MATRVPRRRMPAALLLLAACGGAGGGELARDTAGLPVFAQEPPPARPGAPDTLPPPLEPLPPEPQIVPPAPPPPSRGQILEWLAGQRVLVYKRLFDSVWWTIEPGEISELEAEPAGTDPSGASYVVELAFKVQSEGRGLVVHGVLRHYGSGTREGYAFRDFTPTRVERFGNW